MPFVIDASIVLAWCFDDEDTPLADQVLARLETDEAVAPSIWPLEVANGLRSAERRGRIGEIELPGLIRQLAALPIEVEASSLEQALVEILPLARALSLSAYDAAYVDLALRRGIPLATVDDYLAHAAAAAGAESIAVGVNP